MIGVFFDCGSLFFSPVLFSIRWNRFVFIYILYRYICIQERNYNSFLLQYMFWIRFLLLKCVVSTHKHNCMAYLCALTHYSSIIIISSRCWYGHGQAHDSFVRITTKENSFILLLFHKSVGFFFLSDFYWSSKIKTKKNWTRFSFSIDWAAFFHRFLLFFVFLFISIEKKSRRAHLIKYVRLYTII